MDAGAGSAASPEAPVPPEGRACEDSLGFVKLAGMTKSPKSSSSSTVRAGAAGDETKGLGGEMCELFGPAAGGRGRATPPDAEAVGGLGRPLLLDAAGNLGLGALESGVPPTATFCAVPAAIAFCAAGRGGGMMPLG